jgi:hypothetical protein
VLGEKVEKTLWKNLWKRFFNGGTEAAKIAMYASAPVHIKKSVDCQVESVMLSHAFKNRSLSKLATVAKIPKAIRVPIIAFSNAGRLRVTINTRGEIEKNRSVIAKNTTSLDDGTALLELLT